MKTIENKFSHENSSHGMNETHEIYISQKYKKLITAFDVKGASLNGNMDQYRSINPLLFFH